MKIVFSVKLLQEKFHPTQSMRNDEFKVVLDVSPASKGHALILPKNHYAYLYEIDEM